MRACVGEMADPITSIRVSRRTLHDLERLRRAFQTETAEETIRKLIGERRLAAVSRMLGSGRGRIRPFTDSDRFDSHY